jgi:hypothetical protein
MKASPNSDRGTCRGGRRRVEKCPNSQAEVAEWQTRRIQNFRSENANVHESQEQDNRDTPMITIEHDGPPNSGEVGHENPLPAVPLQSQKQGTAKRKTDPLPPQGAEGGPSPIRVGQTASGDIEADLRTGLARAAAKGNGRLVEILDRRLTEHLEVTAGNIVALASKRPKR